METDTPQSWQGALGNSAMLFMNLTSSLSQYQGLIGSFSHFLSSVHSGIIQKLNDEAEII